MMDYIFFDFNGTIIDDLDLCLKLLNEMLVHKKHSPVSKEKYLEIFTFPVIEYYKKAGFNLPEDDFNALADYFITNYEKENKYCKIFDDIIPTLELLKKQGKHLFILSASEKNMLIKQLKFYNIDKYFDDIIGKDNIYAEGKVELGRNFIKTHNLDLNKCIFIGDTTHDSETALAMGIKCYLISRGHQNKNILSSTKCMIFNSLEEIVKGGHL